jgi:spermidine synthase
MTNRFRVGSLYIFIFLSGVAGLGYEMVWTRMFSVALGHEIVAVLAVVAAFFSGLALGAYSLDGPVSRSQRPARWYAMLEFIVGCWSIALIPLFPIANNLAASLIGVAPSPFQQWLVSFVLPFLLLLPATAAMGGTLPAMERLVSRLRQDGWSVGGLYGANTFGAVVGTLSTTFWLAPALGFNAILLVLAFVNFLCAAGVFLGTSRGDENLPRVTAGIHGLPSGRWLLAALFISGLLGIGYEVIIVRVISQVLENTVYTFASVLSVYLLGTAIGATLYQRYAPRKEFAKVLSSLLAATSLACLIGTSLLWTTDDLYSWTRDNLDTGFMGSIMGELAVAFAVFLLPTVTMGATFTHFAQAARDKHGLGVALGINTIGAALAPLLWGILVLPTLGSKATLIAISLGYVMLIPKSGGKVQFRIAAMPMVVGTVLLFIPAQLSFVTVPPGGALIEHRQGVMAAVSVVRDAREALHLKVNDRFQMGGTSSTYSDRRQAHIPLLLHPHPQRVLFLGLGAGITFAAAADYPGVHADGVELVPEIVQLLPHFEKFHSTALTNDRLRIFVADARRFVSTSKRSYDVIIADLFHPARDGAGSLYTLEHFQAVHALLDRDGIFCQWLPLYQLDLDTLKIIIRTFLEVFPNASAYLAHFSLHSPMIGLVSGMPAGGYSRDWIERRMRDPSLIRVLAELRLQDIYALFGNYLAGSQELDDFASGAPLNTDDLPHVIFRAPLFTYSKKEPSYTRLLALVDRFWPNTQEVLAITDSSLTSDSHSRLARYWEARNQFLHLGVGVPRNQNLAQLLGRLGEPLLGLVRMSSDFDPAYNPLLVMARQLRPIDTDATKALLLALAEANPRRSEAAIMLNDLVDDHYTDGTD